MTRAQEVLEAVGDTMSASKVVKALKSWSGSVVSAKPLAQQLGLDEPLVLKTLNAIAQQGVLKRANYPKDAFAIDVKRMKDVKGIVPGGKLIF